ncbi:MAG: hypothetical protein PVI90_00350 [Desulfobacteraceae bacterium]|jgi:hypothetical protein
MENMYDMSNFVSFINNPCADGFINNWECGGHYYSSFHPCEDRIGEKWLRGRDGRNRLVFEDGTEFDVSFELAQKWAKWRCGD